MKFFGSSTGSLSIPRRTLGIVAVAALALAAGVLLGRAGLQRGNSFQDVSATVLDEPRELGEFQLVDHMGQPFTPERLAGHWSMLFFGYTHCPDVCPTTLATLNNMYEALDEKNTKPPRVIFVSVDPERDTPQQLERYVPFFNDAFLGVTGEADEIDALAKRLGILHLKVDSDGDSQGYLVDHSASILLVNPEARLRAVFGAPHDADRLAKDFSAIAGARG